MDGTIYLIGEVDNDNRYKIGMTRGKASKRKRELQTGNSSELYVRFEYKTETPVMLEHMLHKHFQDSGLINEWFELKKEDADNFIDICDKIQKRIDALKDNPFFKRH